jgi:hypothetical protein
MKQSELDNITSEKSLYDVYKAVVQPIKLRRLYIGLMAATFIGLIASGYGVGVSAVEIGNRVREWSGLGFNFAATVLGILLAGFTIFSTVSMSDLARPLAERKRKDTGLSYLKYIAGHFMAVFIQYAMFIAMHVTISLFGWYGGPTTKLVTWLSITTGTNLGLHAAVLMLGIVGTWFAYLIMVLFSFIFNVYHSFMFMSRAKIQSDMVKTGEAVEPESVEVDLVAVPKVRVGESLDPIAEHVDDLAEKEAEIVAETLAVGQVESYSKRAAN